MIPLKRWVRAIIRGAFVSHWSGQLEGGGGYSEFSGELQHLEQTKATRKEGLWGHPKNTHNSQWWPFQRGSGSLVVY